MSLTTSAEAMLAATLLPLCAGLLLLKLGLWPRRRGTVPHCRGCGYDLTGSSNLRCPECGLQVTPESIVYGVRRRRPMVTALAALFLVVAVGWGVYQGRQIDWYHYAPFSWVMRDIQSQSPTTARKASAEMRRRETQLSKSHRNTLIALGLREQIAASPSPAQPYLIEYLARCCRKSLLSPAQKDTFWQQITSVDGLTVPAEPTAGGEFTYQLRYSLRGPSWQSVEHMLIVIKHGQVRLDDVVVPGHSSWTTAFNDSNASGTTSGPPTSAPAKPGLHRLSLTPTITVYPPADKGGRNAKPCYEREVPLQATFRVVETPRSP